MFKRKTWFILAVVTGFIVIFSIYFKVNPDNIATPMAASLGDITSILIISLLATELYKTIGKNNLLFFLSTDFTLV